MSDLQIQSLYEYFNGDMGNKVSYKMFAAVLLPEESVVTQQRRGKRVVLLQVQLLLMKVFKKIINVQNRLRDHIALTRQNCYSYQDLMAKVFRTISQGALSIDTPLLYSFLKTQGVRTVSQKDLSAVMASISKARGHSLLDQTLFSNYFRVAEVHSRGNNSSAKKHSSHRKSNEFMYLLDNSGIE